MKFVKQILFCLLSALLFFISWPPNSFPIFIFVAFVPILWFVFNFNPGKKVFSSWFLYMSLVLTFFVLNFSLTSWVMKAHWGGGIFASCLNTILMSIVIILVYKIKMVIGEKHALISFPVLWLSFEYLHFNWDLTWPWLTLGNVFSDKITWIQWYEYTGVLGGSLWILTVNTILYYTLRKFLSNQSSLKTLFFALMFLTLPLYISNSILSNFSEPLQEDVNVVIVQPNYEPHNEKFSIPQNTQLLRVESLLDSVWNSDVDLIILPETFIIDWIWESKIEVTPVVKRMRSWLKFHPNTQILTGASTIKLLEESQNKKPTARQSSSGIWYEVFNTALLISVDEPVQIFHKSKLVPGAEMTPYNFIFKPILEKFPIELAGTVGNFGVNDSIFNLNSKQGAFTSLICYESIFGEYVSKFMLKDAEWICLISNDGWWGHTYGHQQLHSYARLRAIENRRYVVRSANTGISSVINPNGIIKEFLPYSKKGIINATIFKSDVITFYSMYGDYIGRLASFLAIVYILQLIIQYLGHKRSIKLKQNDV